MSIPNVNQITTDLRMMGDQQLQQYAAMHKNDPYILPMAIAESNSRKALRAAKQAQEGGQPQGKVADQAIASMGEMQNADPAQLAKLMQMLDAKKQAEHKEFTGTGQQPTPPQGMPPQVGAQMAQQRLPEQQGIGALPVKNMQNMADGGIAGYADGGESQFNYSGGSDGPLMNMAGGGEPVVRMADGGVAHFYRGGWGRDVPFSGDPESALEEERRKNMELVNASMPEEGYTRTDPRAPATVPSAQDQLGQYSSVNATRARDYLPSAATDKKQPPPPNLRPGSTSTPAASAAPEKSAAARLMDMKKEVGGGDRKAIDAKQKEYEESLSTAATERSANLEKEIAARGEYGKAKEERLAAREAGLSKEKDTLLGLSALEMALGFFTGGPNAAIKSTQGALKTYGAGIASLKQAKEKIDDSRDQIDEFRRTESNMTAKERREAANDINRTQIEIKKLGVEGLEKAYGYTEKDATTAFNAATQENLTKLEIQGRKDAARISASAPSSQLQMYSALGGGDPKKGFDYYAAAMGPEAKGEQALLAKYAGPQGEIALKMLETTPEGKIQAQMIRQRLASAMLQPQNVANALP
jgi:hypothetical protein